MNRNEWKERKIRDINSPIHYRDVKKNIKKDTFIGPLYPIENEYNTVNDNTNIKHKSTNNSCKCIIL
tara:strand:- start:704 stop:904 length:201 start_codon:yes stop_codon:yes gene_type:complete